AASQTGSVKGRSHTLHEPPRPVERINGPEVITTHHGHGVRVVTVNNSEPCGLVPGVNTRPEQTMGHYVAGFFAPGLPWRLPRGRTSSWWTSKCRLSTAGTPHRH